MKQWQIILIVGGGILAASVAITAVIVSILSPTPSSSSSSASRQDDDLRDAWFECKVEVLDLLKNPGSAEFPWRSDVRATRGPTGTLTIRAWVDATNGFGAVVRTPFVCEARRSGTNFVATVELLE